MTLVDEELGRVWSEGPDHVIAEWSNVLLTTWRRTVTSEGLEVSRVASHDVYSRNPGGVVVFNIVDHAVPIPPTSVRTKASDVLRETGGHVLCTVTVIEGEGFWASAARAAVATITLFSRAPHPHRVFGSVGAGATWAAEHLLAGQSEDTLVRVAAQLRERGREASTQ